MLNSMLNQLLNWLPLIFIGLIFWKIYSEYKKDKDDKNKMDQKQFNEMMKNYKESEAKE